MTGAQLLLNPNPVPAPTPNNNNNDFIPNNTSPVTKLGAKVFFIECNGAMVPGSAEAEPPRTDSEGS